MHKSKFITQLSKIEPTEPQPITRELIEEYDEKACYLQRLIATLEDFGLDNNREWCKESDKREYNQLIKKLKLVDEFLDKNPLI